MTVSDGEWLRGSVGCVVRMQTAPIADWQIRIAPLGIHNSMPTRLYRPVLVPKPWPMPSVRERVTSRISCSVFSKTLCEAKRFIQSVNSNLVAQSRSLATLIYPSVNPRGQAPDPRGG